jgi:hypothetical protein
MKDLQQKKAERDRLTTFVGELYSGYYIKKPVSYRKFLTDDEYLGYATGNLRNIYPGWLEPIHNILHHNDRYISVLTGAIGVGKTSVVCQFCVPYLLYRIMLLKDPWQYFEKAPAGKMEVSFFNLTKSLSGSRGFSYLQNALMNSPWFIKNGGIVRGTQDKYVDLPLFKWSMASPYAKGFGTVGGNVIIGIMDEIDSQNESEGQRKRVLQAYESTLRRFESRFVKDGASLGRLFLVSSKQDELSFLDLFIEEMKGSENVQIYDKAQWEIFPSVNYCGRMFAVLIGDAYTPPRIIDEHEKLKFLQEGMRIVEVPVEHLGDFERDIIGALRDFAGIAVRGIRRHKLFSSERFIKQCMYEDKPDPIARNTIEVGLEDELPWINFIDLEKLIVPLNQRRYMHLDISLAGDAMALSTATVRDWVESDVEQAEGIFKKQLVPVIETDFCLRVKAYKGDRIPLHSMRKFILDLKASGLNIVKFTADLILASEDTLQILKKSGIDASYFSVDKVLQPYIDLRNLIYEKRWVCCYHPILFFELKHLELDKDKNKIDHPDKVKDIELLDDGGYRDVVVEGSKDMSDAVAGSVYQCLTNSIKPVSKEQITSMVQKLKKPAEQRGLPSDWFISEKTKENLGDNKVLVTDHDKGKQMLETLRKLKQKKTGGGGIM